MFRLKRSIRITGTREDGTAFDPVAESQALDEEERLVRRYQRPRLPDIEHDSLVLWRSGTGHHNAPAMYGATASTAVPQHLDAELDDIAFLASASDGGRSLTRQGLELAYWALAPLAGLAWLACVKMRSRVTGTTGN